MSRRREVAGALVASSGAQSLIFTGNASNGPRETADHAADAAARCAETAPASGAVKFDCRNPPGEPAPY